MPEIIISCVPPSSGVTHPMPRICKGSRGTMIDLRGESGRKRVGYAREGWAYVGKVRLLGEVQRHDGRRGAVLHDIPA
jgi:hypothetical protein